MDDFLFQERQTWCPIIINKLWFSATATCCIVDSSRFLVRLHAHNVITCQPLARSISSFRRSRSRLRSIFACQNAVFVFGSTNSLHPSYPCQKQPLTNIAVLYLRITISGLPGTLLTFSLYLYPCVHSHFRTAISGIVPRLRICDIQRWRCWGVRISGIVSQSNSFPTLQKWYQ